MALVALLRGVNVGGHRTFRPSVLARELGHLGAVNVGAAGTFVIRRPVSITRLRSEISARLPFDAEIMICQGRDVIGLSSRDFFTGFEARPDLVRFVSVLARTPRSAPAMPISLPSTGEWMVRLLARDSRFVVGMYRRKMKVLGHLAALDRIFGVPVTTRNWATIIKVAGVLEDGAV